MKTYLRKQEGLGGDYFFLFTKEMYYHYATDISFVSEKAIIKTSYSYSTGAIGSLIMEED